MSQVQSRPVARTRTGAIYLCLALMLLFPLVSEAVEQSVGPLGQSTGEIGARILTEGSIWLFAGVTLATAIYWEPRTLASIGLRHFTRWTSVWGLGLAVVLIALGGAASFVTYNVLHAPNHTPAQIEQLVRGSLTYAIFLAVRGGVVEEILFRGIAIEQLTVLIGRRWLAALLATSGFVLVHLVHFDFRQLIPIATVSLGLAGAYLWKRNLWINILAHSVIDALALGAVAMRATSLY
jgi:membrane protease YdiL (CAAX protease family)